jgi:hypothetical protein
MINVIRGEYFKNKKYNNAISEIYDIHTVIILNTIGKPVYTYIDGDEDHKICRYCDRDETSTTFNHKSHTVPKFLGNFLVLSSSECDECNNKFSKYETELEKYIKIPLIINTDNRLKNRYGNNISRINNNIIVDGDYESVEFNGRYVMKVFLKFAYAMLDWDELIHYQEVKNVIVNESEEPKISNLLDITLNKPLSYNSVVLYSKKPDIDNEFVDNLLVLNFNMKKYIIFFNKDYSSNKINKDIIEEKYVKLFDDIDIHNHRVKNFNKDSHKIRFNIDKFLDLLRMDI